MWIEISVVTGWSCSGFHPAGIRSQEMKLKNKSESDGEDHPRFTWKSLMDLDKAPGSWCSWSVFPICLSQIRLTGTLDSRCLRGGFIWNGHSTKAIQAYIWDTQYEIIQRPDHTLSVVELVVVHGHAGEDGRLSNGGGGNTGRTIPQWLAYLLGFQWIICFPWCVPQI